NGARDGRQRLVGPTLPFEAIGRHGDNLFDALPFAQQPRARSWTVAVGMETALFPVAAVQFLAQLLQPPDRLRLQPAIGEFLDAVRETALEVAPVERRRLGLEEITPLLLQIRRR